MTKLLLPLLLALLPIAAQAQTWGEGAVMQLTAATAIEYGAASTWVAKQVGPGSVPCGNATFGDPLPGVVKSCRVKPRYACLPSPVGAGTKALVRSGTKGDLIAWYCPGQDMPAMVVCAKATCGLVAMKRAFAAFASDPSLTGLNTAMAPYTRNAYTDPELVAVWLPFADEIRKLGEVQ
ncbi:MAG: hypothetical protein IIA02_10835 [Proteobacteria bacterium]|nr:hypothetical protein [Pseudomonadota bacterium]